VADRDPLAVAVEGAFKEARSQGLSVADASDIVAEVIRSRTAEAEVEGLAPAGICTVQSIVGARTGDPYVQCRVGLEQWQWDVPTAREHALALLAVAEAAVHDAAMLRWMTLGPLSTPHDTALQAVQDLRRFRGDTAREDWRPEGAGR
jgi:hypothetical protein